MDEIKFDYSDHIQMWRHYDNLRQKKNATFLTANSILIAIVGFGEIDIVQLFISVSVLGILMNIAWFLLLLRNAEYIKLHRTLDGKEKHELWKPNSKTPSSTIADSSLALIFFGFWFFIFTTSFVKLSKNILIRYLL